MVLQSMERRLVTSSDLAENQVPVNLATPVTELEITSTSATTVITATPTNAGNALLNVYLRVVTATTTTTLELTYTDVGGSQTDYVTVIAVGGNTQTLANAASLATGSYKSIPIPINTTATAITLKATAGTANQLYVSATLVQY